MAKPLIQLTRKDTPFIFNSNYIEAFGELKDWLISSLILYYYNLDLKLILETDTIGNKARSYYVSPRH